MDLDHLRTFRAVARSGSFTVAAEMLHYAQSTVSVQVRTLELEVDAPLFDRLPRGARLTEAGRRLVPIADQILDLAAAAAGVGEKESDAAGELTVAAPETVVAHRLPSVLRRLRDLHPALTVRLKSMPYHEIRPAVEAGVVDAGFMFQPALRPTASLAVKHLRSEPLHLVAASDHALAGPVPDVADLFAQTNLYLTERGCGYRPLLEHYLDEAGIRPAQALEFNSVEAIRRCVEEGLGVALIPEVWLSNSLQTHTLVRLDWFAPTFEVTTQLVWHPSRWQGPALTALIEASERCIGDSSAEPPPDVAERSGTEPTEAVGATDPDS